MKTAKMKTEMKMGKANYLMYHTEGRKEEHEWKLRRSSSFWTTEIDGEKWLLDDPQKV
jgi:hypothetical protein